MKTLIIGRRGFVGSNLSRHLPQAIGAGRGEIKDFEGEVFNDIYCAAPQAKKWWANQNPEQDWQEVRNLIEACKKLTCHGTFVLFSTVDVYDPPVGVDERNIPSPNSHPYGRHRLLLEQAILEQYGKQARIARLPALVGHGLKKNVIYDLLNGNNVEQINPNSAFQWVNLDFLPSIIDHVKRLAGGQILNVTSEPLPTSEILNAWFTDLKKRLDWDAVPIGYDVRTVHGWEGSHYLYSAEDVLMLHLKPFIEAERA